jgi:molecular chaperone DnaJ
MNPYEILGVDKNANADEIKKAYRKLSKEHHPDKGGNEDKFKDVAAAYDILSDPQKKQNYDMFGDAKANGNPFAGGGFSGAGFGGFDDFIQSFFTGGGRRQQQQPQTKKGNNIAVHVQMNIIDIMKGADKKITFTKNDKCNSCSGKGGENVANCGTCNGSGQHINITQTPYGYMQQVTVCPTCAGDGKVVKNPCKECKGSGTNKKTETISVRVPAGTYHGQQLTMNGAGHHVRDGIPGDLVVIIDEIPDANFKREITPDGMMTNNIKHEMTISISDAVLGTTKTIKSPLEDITFNIEPGCPSGKLYKFDGKGFPVTGRGTGDMYVTVNVNIPTKVTPEAKALFEELRKHE